MTQQKNVCKRSSLQSVAGLKKVVNIVIPSRLDHTPTKLPSSAGKKSAQTLITGSNKYDHITLYLAANHWPPVSFRIYFRVLLITFEALRGLALDCSAELLSS